MGRILLVEDDARTAELVATFLRGEGFDVDTERTGPSGLARLLAAPPDLVILDWMLPALDGLTVCQRAREQFQGPILILTARSEEADQIQGLESGADDYLPKPVRPRLLLARIRALLRRTDGSREAIDERIVAGWITVDRATRTVWVADSSIETTTAEFDLLWLLARHQGTAITRDQLFEELRGIPYDGLDRSMDMRVSQLRKRLVDADPERRDPIRTVRGIGYQLVKTPT